MATRKSESTATKAAKSVPAPKSMPKGGRDPKGGLTVAGRAFFEQREGLHLKAGVTGAADTPEKMKRKGSFLVRTFSNPRGPMKDDKGQPTRLALSAHAWGEKVPTSVSGAHKLASKGHELLSKFHATQDKAKAEKTSTSKSTKKQAIKKASVKKPVAKKSATKKSVLPRTK